MKKLVFIFLGLVLLTGCGVEGNLNKAKEIREESGQNREYSSEDNALVVYVSGLRSSTHPVICLAFANEDQFNDGQAMLAIVTEPVQYTAQATFEGLPAGHYSILCWQDKNNNKELDKTFYGKPTEDCGCSSNHSQGIPTFDNTVFEYPGGVMKIYISMKHF